MSMKSFRLWRKRLFGAVWWFSNNVSEVADLVVTLCLCVEFACSGSAWVPSWYSSFRLESTSMGLMVSGNNTVSMGVSVDYCVHVGPALNWPGCTLPLPKHSWNRLCQSHKCVGRAWMDDIFCYE